MRRPAWVLAIASVPMACALAVALLLSAPSVQAQTVTALQDTTCAGSRSGGALGCSAGEFTVNPVFAAAPGTAPFCNAGDHFVMNVSVNLSGTNANRYDVGFFVGQDFNDPRLTTGMCSVGTFPESPAPWADFEVAQVGDTCGDYTANGNGTPVVQSVKVLCTGDANSNLQIPYTLTYSQNGNDVCTGPTDVKNGAPSKCNAGIATVTPTVLSAGYVDLTKQTTPDGDAQSFTYTATGPSGSVVGVLIGTTYGTGNTNSHTFTLADGQTARVYMTINTTDRTLNIVEAANAAWETTAAISCAATRGTPTFSTNNATRTIDATLNTTNIGGACTITNTKRARISLVKNVNNRVVAADQFTVAVSGAGSGTLTSSAGAAIAASAVTVTTTGAGTGNFTNATHPSFYATGGQALTFTDAMAAGSTSTLADYETRLTCTNAYTGVGATTGLPSNALQTTFNLTPVAGDDITCTYTNTPRPRLTLQKAIAAAGGGRVAATDQFALANGTSSGTTTGTGTSVTSGAVLFVGTSGNAVTLSEAAAGTTDLANYSTAISCSNSNGSSSTTLPSGSGTSFSITPVNNDVIACTLTNTRKAATLTLRKAWTDAVVNNAVDVSATGINSRTFASVANSATETDTDGTSINVFAGETIALAEAFTTGSAANYTVGLACTGNNGALTYTAGSLNGSLAITNADAAIVCTFANTRRSAALTLQKAWINGLAGDAIAVTTTGAVNNATHASTSTGNNTTAGTAATVFAGESITLPAETFTTGSATNYVRTLACTGNTNALAGGTAPQTLTVAPADGAITCTYTNARTSLTLVKAVTNDNGGTQAATAWTLTATGPQTISGATGSAAVTDASISAGTYALSETGPGGYTAGSWNCVGGSQAGSSITLTTGQAATCTIANDDQAATLTLAKTVTNGDGGTAVATAWTLTATGPTTISGATGSAAVTSAPVSAGTYTLTESGPAGYTAGSWSCSAGSLTGNSLTLANGEVASCGIVNDDQPATLTLVKTVTNDDGGTAVATDWTLTATGPTTISGATGTAAVTNATVDAGTYTLTESGPPNYAAGAWSCSAGALTGNSLVLGSGVTASCSINNDDQKVSDLALTKTDAPDPVRAGETLVYTLTVTNNGPTAIASTDTFNVADTLPAGLTGCAYLASAGTYTSGTGAWTGATIASGGSVTLTITCTVDPGYSAATLSNSAGITVPPGFSDPVPGNDSAGPVVTTVTREANLSVTKSNATGTLVAGSTTTYTLTITNAGPANADNATLTDPAVPGLAVTAVNCTGSTGGGTCPAVVTVVALQGGGLVIPTLPAGATVTFTVTATVTATGQ